MKKKLMSLLLTLCMVLSLLPAAVTTAKADDTSPASTTTDTSAKSEVTKSTYEDLGFSLNATDDSQPYFGPSTYSSIYDQNELYVDLNGSSNHGDILRDNLNLSQNYSSYKNSGAYQRYGQYTNQDWANLSEDNGYTYGQTGGTTLYSGIKTDGKHLNRAYATSVAYNNGSGTDKMMARLYVRATAKRSEYSAYLEFVSFPQSGYAPTTVASIWLGSATSAMQALDENGYWSNQEFDALFDITAGDYDGDGRDEIAVYAADNQVRIYKTGSASDASNNSISLWKTIAVPNSGVSVDSDSYTKVTRAAVVALASGDLKKDYSEDLAIAVSMPRNTSSDNVITNSNVLVYGTDGKSAGAADSFKLDKTIPLQVESGVVLRYANVAIGDVNGDGCKEMTVGGYHEANDTGSNQWSKLGVEYVAYNHSSKRYSVTKPQYIDVPSTSFLVDGNKNARYIAPVGMGCVNIDGSTGTSGGDLFLYDRLYKLDSGTLSYSAVKDGALDIYEAQKNNVNDKVDKDQRWVSDVIVGNFNGNRTGQEQILVVIGTKEKDNDAYWYQFGYLSDNGDSCYHNCEGIISQATSYLNQNSKSRATPYVDIAAPDVDDDSVVLQYQGSETYYSKPEVQAVLQSMPYFQDVADVNDNYLNNGCTAYGRSTGSSSSTSSNISASLGIYTAAEISFFGEGEFEAEVSASVSYSHEQSMDTTTSVEYSASAGDDYVVMYTIPYHRYYYKALIPGGETIPGTTHYNSYETYAAAQQAAFSSILYYTSFKKYTSWLNSYIASNDVSGDTDAAKRETVWAKGLKPGEKTPSGWTDMIVEEPMQAATVIVPVETYDAIAARTAGLEPIGGNLLTSTPGDPSTYTSWPSESNSDDGFEPIGDVQQITNAGSNSGSIVTVSREVEKSSSNSFEIGVEESLKVGAGVGFLGTNAKSGVTQTAGVSAGKCYSNMKGVAYTGSVDNLPAGVSGFGFDWQLGVEQTKLNGEDVMVVAYQTKNVKAAPAAPKNLTITDIASDSLKLNWSATADAAAYELYLVSANGDTLYQATIPGTAKDEDGSVTYTATGLDPATTYTYKVAAVSGKSVRSLFSQAASATTLADTDGAFSITEQPKDTSAAPGNEAAFEVSAVNNTGNNKTVQYQWQNFSEKQGQWNNISGALYAKLTLSDVTKDLDGTRYRCLVYLQNSSTMLYSREASLTVNKSGSATGLSLAKDGAALTTDPKTVTAAGSSTSSTSGTTTVWSPVTLPSDVTTYTKMAAAETVTDTDSGTSYSYSEPYLWMDQNGNCYTFTGDTQVGASLPVSNLFTYTDGTTSKTVMADSALTDLTSTVIAEGKTSTSGYRVSDGVYIYRVGTTVDENTTYTYYYNTGTSESPAYTQAEPDADGSTVTISGNAYSISALAIVKSQQNVTTTGTTTTKLAGDTVTLTATPKSGATALTDGSVQFAITDQATGLTSTVDAVLNAEKTAWTATYEFPTAGVYSVAAVYSGSSRYFGSTSAAQTVYAVSPNTNTMTLSGATITYGDTAALNPTKLTTSGMKALTSGVSYSVLKDGAAATENTDYTIVNNVFTPKAIGTYTILASYVDNGTTLTATSTITVYTRTVTIQANNVTAAINAENKADKMTATVTGALDADKAKLAYTLKSDATTAATQGDYDIGITLSSDAQTFAKDKYSVVLVKGTYTLTSTAYTVAASAGPNGSVSIGYTSGDVKVSNLTGTQSIPEGAKVTVTAQPNSGYEVADWTDDAAENGTAAQYTIGSLSKNTTVGVSFTQSYSTLTFVGYYIDSGSNYVKSGTVTGKFSGSDLSFQSGDKINMSQTVVLTAVPETNYSISAWQTKKTGDTDWTTLKAEDGTSNYTGASHSFSGITKDTAVRVIFAPKTAKSVTVQFKYKDGSGYVTGAGVKFGGTAATVDSSNTYTYSGFVGDNLTIDVTVPSNLIIDHWENDGAVIANGITQLKLYDLKKDETNAYVIYCAAPTSRTVTFGGTLDGSALTAAAGAVSAARVGATSSALTSPASVPQGAQVQFTATVNDGYEISGWTVGGTAATATTVAGSSSQTLTRTIDGDTTVSVAYRKKPVITVTNGDNGTVAMAVTGTNAKTVAADGFVEFGDALNVTVTPNVGYTVASVTVGGNTTALTAVANSDAKTFTVSNIQADQTIVVTYAAIKSVIVTYSVRDKNGDGTGRDGEIKADVARGSDPLYAVTGTKKTSATLTPVYSGSTVTFTAAPATGYRVSQWLLNGSKVLRADNTTTYDDAAYTLTTNDDSANADVQVQYELIGDKVTYGATGSGTVSAAALGRDFVSGSSVTAAIDISFTAVPATGWEIQSWTVNNEVQQKDGQNITDPDFVYSADGKTGADIHVNFVRSSYTVTYGAAAGGSVTALKADSTPIGTSPASVVGDTVVTFTATPSTGYHFVKWVVDGKDSDVTAAALTQTITAAKSVQAVFALTEQKYTVTYSGTPDEGGTVTAASSGYPQLLSNSQLPQQSAVTFTATPASGYMVQKWTVNDTDIPNSIEKTTYSVPSLLQNTTVVVTFVPIPAYTITVATAGNGSGQISYAVSGGEAQTLSGTTVSVPRHGSVVLTMTPASGNSAAWTAENGTVSGSTLTYTDVTADQSCTATFTKAVQITVKAAVQSVGAATGTISKVTATNDQKKTSNVDGAYDKGVEVTTGQTLTFTATPGANSMVEGWYKKTTATTSGKVSTVRLFGTAPEGYTQVAGQLGNTLTLTDVNSDTDVLVKFTATVEHTVTAVGNHCTVTAVNTPDWTAGKIRDGGTVTFTAAPEDGYAVSALTATGTTGTVTKTRNADGTWTVTVPDITSDITFTATAAAAHSVTFTAGAGGSVTAQAATADLPAYAITTGAKVADGTSLSFKATANTGYSISGWTADPTGTASADKTTYTINSLTKDAAVSAAFSAPGGGGGGGGSTGFTVTFKPQNGEADSTASVESGKTVAKPADPARKWYYFAGWYTDENGTQAYDFTKAVSANLTLYAKWTPHKCLAFTDIDGHWAREPICWMVENDLMNGETTSLFAPDDTLSRGMIVTILYRASGSPAVTDTLKFPDVKADEYYANAIIWATGAGVAKGYDDGSFQPERLVSREELAAFLARYSSFMKYDADKTGELDKFADGGTVSTWALDAMRWAVGNGVVNGRDDGSLDPQGTATRAEAAAMMSRFLEAVKWEMPKTEA